MANGNGDLEGRVPRLEIARKEIEDSLIVMAQLEARMTRNLREQAEWLADLEPRMQRAEKLLAEMAVRDAAWEIKNSEMQGKIDFLFDREMRREGGPEAR